MPGRSCLRKNIIVYSLSSKRVVYAKLCKEWHNNPQSFKHEVYKREEFKVDEFCKAIVLVWLRFFDLRHFIGAEGSWSRDLRKNHFSLKLWWLICLGYDTKKNMHFITIFYYSHLSNRNNIYSLGIFNFYFIFKSHNTTLQLNHRWVMWRSGCLLILLVNNHKFVSLKTLNSKRS